MESIAAREIRRSYRSVTGSIASRKNARMVRFESTLERDYYLLQEFDRSVIEFEEQPLRVAYWDGDSERHYFPDALTTFADGTHELVEVKYQNDLREHQAEYAPGFEAAQVLAKRRGWQFRIMSEVEIRTARLGNVWMLLPFRDRAHDEAAAARLLQSVAAGPKTIRELLDGLSEKERLVAQRSLWCLLADGLLDTNLEASLGGESLIAVVDHESL